VAEVKKGKGSPWVALLGYGESVRGGGTPEPAATVFRSCGRGESAENGGSVNLQLQLCEIQ
jgi:hypothetical protein